MKIVTVDQMQALEGASAAAGTSTDTLMENAGLAAARLTREAVGGAAGVRVLVLAGPGNNGGDGLVASRYLRRWGAEVTAYVLRPRQPGGHPPGRSGPGRRRDTPRSPTTPRARLLAGELGRARVVMDAVLGTGRARPLEGEVRDAMLSGHVGQGRQPPAHRRVPRRAHRHGR